MDFCQPSNVSAFFFFSILFSFFCLCFLTSLLSWAAKQKYGFGPAPPHPAHFVPQTCRPKLVSSAVLGLPRGRTEVRLKTPLPHPPKCLSDCLWENSTLPACPQDGPPKLDVGDAGRAAGGGGSAGADAHHVPRRPPPHPGLPHPDLPPKAWSSSTHRLWTQAADRHFVCSLHHLLSIC